MDIYNSILSKPTARWLGVSWPQDFSPEPNSYFAYRRVIKLNEKPTKAPTIITGDSRYWLWVNGKLVIQGPQRGLAQHWHLDPVNLVPYLKRGKNCIAVLLHSLGVNTGQYRFNGRTGIWCDGIWNVGRKKVRFRSDDQWRVRRANWYITHHERSNIFWGFQEWLDKSLEPKNWKLPSFDDSDWSQAFPLGPLRTYPWLEPEMRFIDNLVDEPESIKIAAKFSGPVELECDHQKNICSRLSREVPRWSVSYDENKSLGKSGKLTIPAPGKGRAVAYLLDVGSVGALLFEANAVAKGRGGVLELAYISRSTVPDTAKELSRWIPDPYVDDLRTGVADRFILSAGKHSLRTLSVKGARTVLVVWRDSTRSLELTGLKLIRQRYPFPKPREFPVKDAFWRQCWDVSLNTLDRNTLDAFLDNTKREMSEWLHDGCLMGITAAAVYGDCSVWRSGMLHWAQSQFPGGQLQGPFAAGHQPWPAIDYTFVWVKFLREYWWISGDQETVCEVWPTVMRIVQMIEKWRTSDGLIVVPEECQHFIEHARIDRRAYSAPVNLFVLWALQSAEELGGVIDASVKDMKQITKLRKSMAANITRAFWVNKKGQWKDHVEPSAKIKKEMSDWVAGEAWPRGDLESDPNTVPPCSIFTAMLSVLTGAANTKAKKEAALKVIDELLVYRGRFLPSPIMFPHCLEALFMLGRPERAWQAVRDLYGPYLSKTKATQWPEHVGDTEPDAQGVGSALNYIFVKHMLGLYPKRPGGPWVKESSK